MTGKRERNPAFVRSQIAAYTEIIRLCHIDRRRFGDEGGYYAHRVRENNIALRVWKERLRLRGAV